MQVNKFGCSNGEETLLRFFFFNDTATTEIYTLSLHDALPIFRRRRRVPHGLPLPDHAPHVHERPARGGDADARDPAPDRSEEHTSELQSRQYLVCRLLLEKKKYCTQSLFLLCRLPLYLASVCF